MTISFLYLICLVTGAGSLAIAFWVQRIDATWFHIFVMGLTSPTFVGFAGYLACRTSVSEESQLAKALYHRRSYMIAIIPCCLAVLFLDFVRFVLYIQINNTLIDLVFINIKIFYIAFQVLFFAKYLSRHLEENLLTRLFLMHLIGANIFFWTHEFSIHSAHSLESLREEHTKAQAESTAKLTLKILEASEPYVYPLVIQFMIVASGASYQIWLNMRSLDAKVHDIYIDDDYSEIRPNRRHRRTVRYVTGPLTPIDLMETNIETSERSVSLVSCGLVLGAFVFVGLVFSGLSLLSNRVDRDTAITIYYSYQLVLFLGMTVASFLFLNKLSNERNSSIDVADLDILILLPMLGYLLYSEFSFVASFTEVFVNLHSALLLSNSLARVVQSIAQTLVISKAFRYGFAASNQNCCSPVFNSMIFLLFANAGLWITESIFDLRIDFVSPVQCKYFGKSLWGLIKFTLFPLCILFRFISCTTLLDILLWSDGN